MSFLWGCWWLVFDERWIVTVCRFERNGRAAKHSHGCAMHPDMGIGPCPAIPPQPCSQDHIHVRTIRTPCPVANRCHSMAALMPDIIMGFFRFEKPGEMDQRVA